MLLDDLLLRWKEDFNLHPLPKKTVIGGELESAVCFRAERTVVCPWGSALWVWESSHCSSCGVAQGQTMTTWWSWSPITPCYQDSVCRGPGAAGW